MSFSCIHNQFQFTYCIELETYMPSFGTKIWDSPTKRGIWHVLLESCRLIHLRYVIHHKLEFSHIQFMQTISLLHLRTILPKNLRQLGATGWQDGMDSSSINLWAALISTLCACVNNPLNGQCFYVSVSVGIQLLFLHCWTSC